MLVYNCFIHIVVTIVGDLSLRDTVFLRIFMLFFDEVL